MVKSLIQVLFIVIKKTVQRTDEIAHAFLFLILLFGYIVFNRKYRTFNYDRIWHWNFVCLCGVLWAGVLATANLLINQSFLFLLLMFVGWFALVLYGVLEMRLKYPSMLKSP
jgi:hypothetical protein